MSDSLVTKHVRLIQESITRTGVTPEQHVVGSWEEWHKLRDEVRRLNYNQWEGEHIKAADCDTVNFLLCGVPCVAEPVPIKWDGNHILIELL